MPNTKKHVQAPPAKPAEPAPKPDVVRPAAQPIVKTAPPERNWFSRLFN